MSVGERDKKMSEIASIAAGAFCEKYWADPDVPHDVQHVKINPQEYLQHTVPYVTVRTLQRQEIALDRHEKALKSLEADSRWIKRLTIALVILTIVLAFYAFRLDTVLHSLSQ
jgi:hypothetical protein